VSNVAGSPLETFLAELERLRSDAATALAGAADAAAIEAARIEFAGARSGRLKAVQKALGGIPAGDKPAAGRHFNETKAAVATLLDAAQARLGGDGDREAGEAVDVTLPGEPIPAGHLHPLTQTIRQVQEIMGQLGFESVYGPEVEDQGHNFEALAISAEHPARDPLDNSYLAVAKAADPLPPR